MRKVLGIKQNEWVKVGKNQAYHRQLPLKIQRLLQRKQLENRFEALVNESSENLPNAENNDKMNAQIHNY